MDTCLWLPLWVVGQPLCEDVLHTLRSFYVKRLVAFLSANVSMEELLLDGQLGGGCWIVLCGSVFTVPNTDVKSKMVE